MAEKHGEMVVGNVMEVAVEVNLERRKELKFAMWQLSIHLESDME